MPRRKHTTRRRTPGKAPPSTQFTSDVAPTARQTELSLVKSAEVKEETGRDRKETREVEVEVEVEQVIQERGEERSETTMDRPPMHEQSSSTLLEKFSGLLEHYKEVEEENEELLDQVEFLREGMTRMQAQTAKYQELIVAYHQEVQILRAELAETDSKKEEEVEGTQGGASSSKSV
jgi:chromosome segregation ATPase